jgi:hypothetical protein
MAYDFLASEQALAEFVDQFERGTLLKPIWNHAAHLAIGTWYLVTFPANIAIERVRAGIRHYNECVGTANTPDSGYHETLTLFWLNVIAGEVSGLLRATARSPPEEKLNAMRRVVEKFGGQRDLFKRYYSFDVVGSREARARWVPPDRIVSDIELNIVCDRGNKSTAKDI